MNFEDYCFVIPARRNSKGFPYKNRKLLNFTLKSIPKELYGKIIVTTDDEWIEGELEELGVDFIHRSEGLSADDICMKDVVLDVLQKREELADKNIVLLYLTYPQRTFEQVQEIVSFYEEHGARSLLCSKKVESHPFLCLFKTNDHRGKQIIDHDLYRRQDYPECFELSHFMCIFYAKELKNLNKNLYNSNTLYYPVSNVIDVDTSKNFTDFLND